MEPQDSCRLLNPEPPCCLWGSQQVHTVLFLLLAEAFPSPGLQGWISGSWQRFQPISMARFHVDLQAPAIPPGLVPAARLQPCHFLRQTGLTT